MPDRVRLWGVAAGVLGLTLALGGCATTGADEQTRGANQQGYVGVTGTLTQIPPADRAAVPTISGPGLESGTTVSSADYAGKVVVLNVWGSWCAPCQAEAADLQAASVATKDTAQFIGINTKDYSAANPLALVRAKGITYPSIFDPNGEVLLELSGPAKIPPSAIPSTLVLDRQGRVAVRVLNTVTRQTLIDMIDYVADGQ